MLPGESIEQDQGSVRRLNRGPAWNCAAPKAKAGSITYRRLGSIWIVSESIQRHVRSVTGLGRALTSNTVVISAMLTQDMDNCRLSCLRRKYFIQGWRR